MNQKQVVIYSKSRSWRCWRVKRFLTHKRYAFEDVDMANNHELLVWLTHFTEPRRMPYVFVDGRPVGGFDDIKVLERSGNLDRLVRGEV